MIPFTSVSEALQWWIDHAVKDCAISVLIDEPEFRAACPYGTRRTIDPGGPTGWRLRYA